MTPSCRFCAAPLRHSMVDLGMSPLANVVLDGRAVQRPVEVFLSHCMRVGLLGFCLLVQLEQFETPAVGIFGDYAYFSRRIL